MQARALRAAMVASARYLPDDVALAQPAGYYAAWSGEGTPYVAGDIRTYEGGYYRCVQAHVSQADWTPSAAPSLWACIVDPAQEWPEWVQPTGAHDVYAKGAKVSYGGKRWTSDIDGNTWEPGAYGWTEVTTR